MSVQFFVLYFFPHRHLPSCTDLLGFLRPASLCCCHSESISQSMIRKTHFINIAFTNRFSQCIHTCFVHCPSISFTTFVSQREKYILTVYSPLASYMYILWLDRFISLHTALCSSTLDLFSPKAKSPVSWLGFNKCSLLLTSYFSKKNYSGGKGGLEWTALYASTSVSGQFSAPAFTADQNVKLLFLQQSVSRTAGAPLVISELGKGLKCRLPCSEQHASYH